MTNFYSLSDQEQADRMRALALTALKQWDGEFHDISLVKYRENAVFSVFDSRGSRFALRIHRHGYHSDAALLSELKWMNAIKEHGIGAPKIVAAKCGAMFVYANSELVPEPRQVDLLEWLPGEPVGSVETIADGDANELQSLYVQAGELAARLHIQSLNWTIPADFERHAWDENGLLGSLPFWGDFRALRAFPDEARPLLDRACEKALVELHAFGKSKDRYGLIHADFVPENLMRVGEELMLIDFDDSGFGWNMFELATALYFYIGTPHFGTIGDSLLSGYRRHRPLPEDHWNKLPLFLFLRSLTYLGWVHTRHETETAKELTPMFVERTIALARDYLN